MDTLAQLTPQLKHLRLSGVLDSLEVRNRQAIEDRLSYTEFLSRVLEDEVERRNQKQLRLRLRRAAFRGDKTLESFDFAVNPTINRQQLFDLATGLYIQRHENVLICGPTGVGKSHLAQALGHEACRRGYDVLFVSAPKLLQHLHGGRADNTYERRLQTYLRPDLLIVDDFGLKPLRPPEDETFHDLMAERYERAATVLTSNLDFGEWGEAFPANKLLGAATLDRLRHGAYRLILDGDSYRSPKPLPPAASHPVAKGGKTTHA
jgi:DNA replication protein DnaC